MALTTYAASAATTLPSGAKATAPLVFPDYDRLSTPPVAEDPYETLPLLRYRLAPSTPIVTAIAGAPGSGSITVHWVQTYLGRGYFGGFSILSSNAKTLLALPDARSATFSHLAAGTYSFTVSALGYYSDTSATSKAVRLLPTPPPVVVAAPAGCGYLIDVNLTTQSMVASHCGRVFISSLITSGRPGYRSPTGTFYTSTKYYHVWFEYKGLYTPRYVKYAIRFWGLYYLHTWSQPSLSAFGPGSQNGQYASLGCIEMPDNVMAALMNWAPSGTAVHIHY
jgi:lipoprotein-anchoring transpeptidase ErfK/SrfK